MEEKERGEKKGETERQRDRETERQRDRETETDNNLSCYITITFMIIGYNGMRRQYSEKLWAIEARKVMGDCTVCPRSFDPVHIVSYYIIRVKTSWTQNICICSPIHYFNFLFSCWSDWDPTRWSPSSSWSRWTRRTRRSSLASRTARVDFRLPGIV